MIKANFEPVRGKKLLVALSGGADSVALLSLLREAGDCRLVAAHFDHGIRSGEARADADFCRRLCEEWGVEYHEGRGDVPGEARKRGLGLETAARELRYEFLREKKRETGADWIALAHHLDDQAETVLMHLLRGAGPAGIAGMRMFAGDLYRPLLGFRKEELIEYLRERRVPWREDATNAAEENPRNILRLRVMPALERAYPMAARAIARYAESAALEDDFVREAAAAWLAESLESGPYGRRVSMKAPPHEAILRRGLRTLLTGEADHGELRELCRLAGEMRGRIQLPGGGFAERAGDWLYLLPERLTPPPEPVPLRLPGEIRLPGLCRVTAEPYRGEPIRENGPAQTLDRAALEGAVLRTRRDGDRIHPFGAEGEKLLSDYLIDRKVDRPLRDALPLLARGNRVLWVVGLGIAREAALRPGAEGVRLTAREE